MQQTIARVVNLVPESNQLLLDGTLEDALKHLVAEDAEKLRRLRGSFALVARDHERVLLARSLNRPLRYFLAKEEQGPMLVVAETIREIAAFLAGEGYSDQFQPAYTRMVPAHHVTCLRLIGCPDPNPAYRRFLGADASLPNDPETIGRRYVGALREEIAAWYQAVPTDEPLGVLFSGGVDSGAVFLTLYRVLLEHGGNPSRLKAFTLAAGGRADLDQAREFLRHLDLELFLEPIEVDPERVDPWSAIEVIEDYKPRDVECAAVNLALLAEIRNRYPQWKYLIDGDGGDENLKDYPIEENPELTIRSVVNNPFLYQEGWGVDTIKHSLTYSGGLSRGCVRMSAPMRRLGFVGHSPFAAPRLVEIAASIPFAELAQGDHQRLYALKGEVVRRGVREVLDFDMPVFPKRRFQEGAIAAAAFESKFAVSPEAYRNHFFGLYQRRSA